ncbi:OsmC family protein [Marinobacterium arenosum]|uniref:OsmC family protein n=1 Tax=Marinobacterium arenosum TaxID=2862496 RepID=UPI001C97EB06|nr:OsmC family protein [Marinobacterium arenosum]MBY4676216.1 OsmC family protein [Marinobacterium arenosum]
MSQNRPLKTISVTTKMGASSKVEASIRDHRVVIDQPRNAGGTDEGPTPLEYFLFSLGGCIATIARLAASQQGIELRGIEVQLEAGLNLAGLLGKPTEDRVGFQYIDVKATLDADLNEQQKVAFLDEVCERCPLHDNIRFNTQVEHGLS